jgi:pimeloyl-ACP methyl ester carboxylesterase
MGDQAQKPAAVFAFFGAIVSVDSSTSTSGSHRVTRFSAPTGFAEAPGVAAILPHSRHYQFHDGAGLDPDAVTIAWGAKDRLLIGGQARRAQRLLPAARHIRLPASGHVPMSDNPAQVADLILSL